DAAYGAGSGHGAVLSDAAPVGGGDAPAADAGVDPAHCRLLAADACGQAAGGAVVQRYVEFDIVAGGQRSAGGRAGNYALYVPLGVMFCYTERQGNRSLPPFVEE